MDENIKDEKLQYDIKREAPKMSALSSVEIDKYEYCTDEKLDWISWINILYWIWANSCKCRKHPVSIYFFLVMKL